ncbi:MAG TPA: Fur family transcriptional regulator [Ktedonobacterales bacterium]
MEAGQSLPKSEPSYVERLRRQGLRVTPQRLIVLEALAAHSGHISADEILQWAAARYPAINLATIYRTLDLLISIGLVAQTDFGSGVSFFELVGDAPHHHLVCEHCHAVLEIDNDVLRPLQDSILRDYGFLTNSRHLALFGCCGECKAALEKDLRVHP